MDYGSMVILRYPICFELYAYLLEELSQLKWLEMEWLELKTFSKILQGLSLYSAFMIGDGKLLTNAHCVEHDTQVII
jgi:hypothetical protein